MKLILFLVLTFFPHEYLAAKAVTHEDIRDAMLTLVQLLRDNIEKLERHEARERQLGEHLRKALSGLDSRERAQDGLLRSIVKKLDNLDERMNNLQELSRAPLEAPKSAYAVEGLPIETWSTQVQTLINEQDSSKSKMDALESNFNSKIDYLASLVEKMQSEMILITSHVSTIAAHQRSPSNSDSQVALYHDWHKSVKDTLETHSNMLYNIINKPQESYKDNSTLDEVISFRNEIMMKLTEGDLKKEVKLDEIQHIINNTERVVVNTIKDSAVETFGNLNEIENKLLNMEKDSNTVQNVEKILVQTSDNVMDTKRRIEYGVHQILQEVREFLTSQSSDLNLTVSHKFEKISDTIAKFQSNTVGNLSTQVEKELSQVWRQIGVMHQQITTSAGVLDKLQNETDTFISENGNKMDEVASKLDNIGSNVNQIQDNHNFLMGRLSLFTHEFNETRAALTKVSEYMRETYDPTGKKNENHGPGPIFLDGKTEYKHVDENKL